MALEDEMTQAPQEQGLTDEQEADLSIAVNLAKDLIDQGGFDVIEQALATKDPGQIIGQFLMQMVSQMGEQLPQDVTLDPSIFFAVGGWIEQISDYLQEEYDVPKEVMDRAEIYIGTAAQEMSKGQAAQPAAPQPEAPLPQGAM